MRLVLAAALMLTAAGCAVPVETPRAAAERPPTSAPDAVELTAEAVPFEPGLLHRGGTYSCVKATVTNRRAEPVRVSPYYWALTDRTGVRQKGVVGQADGEFDSMDLATGETASGVVCVEGQADLATVTFTLDRTVNVRARVR